LDASWIGESTLPIIAGTRFIPFRAKLSQQLVAANQIGNTLKIAVVAGGSDPYQLVLEIAKILSRVPGEFEVLLFSNAFSQEGLDSRFKFIEIGPLLDELTQSVDLVLTTSSTSSLEFIARGLCVGVACAVDNQRQYYDSLGHAGAAAQIGIRNSSGKWELEEEVIFNLVTSPELRKKLVSNSVGLIDFNGASRIVDAIQAL
jgi:spore coat polysaccharide biosynthesis predicted glycosyltransferase SpsG